MCAQGVHVGEYVLDDVVCGGDAADGDDFIVAIKEDEMHFLEVKVAVDGNLYGFLDDLVSEGKALLDAVVEVGEDDVFGDAATVGDGVLGSGLLLCHDGFSLSAGWFVSSSGEAFFSTPYEYGTTLLNTCASLGVMGKKKPLRMT